MLYVNGKRLENADQYWKDKYEEVIDRLWKASKDKNKFSVVFTVAPHRIITQETVNGGKVHTTGTELVNLTRTIRVKDKDGRERNVNFVYSESPLDEKDGKVNAKDQTTLHRMFGDNNITETIRDEELAFFLYFVHPKFGEEGSKKPYYLIDERSRAEKKVELAQDDVEFKYLLYSSNSPIRQDENKMRMLAGAWGVEDAQRKELPMVITELERLVGRGEYAKKMGRSGARGVSEFIEDTNFGEIVELMAIVQMAEDSGIIGVEAIKPNQLGVYWMNEKQERAGKIIGLTGKTLDNWRIKMADHLSGNQDVLSSVKIELGIDTDDDRKVEEKQKNNYYDLLDHFFEDEYRSQAKNICKYFGIRTAGVKKELWREELIRILKDRGEIAEDYE